MSLLKREVAVARFGVVVIVEIFALLICFLPLVGTAHQWQRDCQAIGAKAAIVTVSVCALVLALASLVPRPRDEGKFVRRLEWGIITTYILNVLFLLLVIARTGGPTSSLYGTLIPIQLSAMLFLQLEKDRFAEKPSRGLAVFYLAIGLMGYLASYRLRTQIGSWRLLYVPDPSPVDYAATNAPWTAALTVLAMLLSFLTYVVPSNERLLSKIRSSFAAESVEKK